jgi:hypothetical protein
VRHEHYYYYAPPPPVYEHHHDHYLTPYYYPPRYTAPRVWLPLGNGLRFSWDLNRRF